VRQISILGVGLIFAVGTLSSCSDGPGGWRQLWKDQWSWHHQGWHWALGVEADGARIGVDQDGQQFRADVHNFGTGVAMIELVSSSDAHRWELQPAARSTVEVSLPRGEYSVRASGGVVLGSPRLGRPLAEPRLLEFVVVDTLRADHVNHRLTPAILDQFTGAHSWHQATANCSWTLPSVASIFTSRTVLELTSPEGDLIGIPDGASTWASRLESAGFAGGAVVANYTIHALNGFASGFSSYSVPDGSGSEQHPDATWVVAEGARWLGAHRGEDSFLYLHLMDPHQPYRNHENSSRVIPDLKPLALRRRTATEEEAELLHQSYADEVRHVDQVLAPFLAELPSNAMVVFTSDHGEALGEHGAWGHGLNLFQEALLVPLLIRGPGVAQAETSEPVQLLDLAPTMLDLMGVDTPEGMIGGSLLNGGAGQPLVSTTFGGGPLRWAWRDGDHKVTLRMAAQPGLGERARSAMEEGSPLPSGGFLYDLAADPSEQVARQIPDDMLGRCGRVFAADAGRMVPGIQLMVWGERGAVTRAIEVPGAVEIVQAWSVAPMSVDRGESRLALGCEDGYPLCSVAARVDPVPDWVRAVGSPSSWRNLPAGEAVPVPAFDVPSSSLETGTYVWWNPDRPLVVGAHDETIERLRALGYIE